MQRSSIATGQKWIKEHMEALGYKADKGVCFGISSMAMQAILANDLETFDARLRLIHSIPPDQLSERIKEVKHKIIAFRHSDQSTPIEEFLSREEQLLISIPAFMEGIALYQNPNEYPQLFEKKPARQDVKAVAPLVSPQHVGEVKKISFFSGAYDIASLEKYLDELALSLKNCDVPIAFILQSESHGITISYDRTKNVWTFTDANQLTTKFKTTPQMASSIIDAFSKNKQAIISTSIFSAAVNQNTIENAISGWVANERNHITKKNVMLADSRQRTWLSMAVNTNNINLVQTLLLRGANPTIAITSVNKEENGLTPLHYAVAKKNEAMVLAMVITILKSIPVDTEQLTTMAYIHTEELMKCSKEEISAYLSSKIPTFFNLKKTEKFLFVNKDDLINPSQLHSENDITTIQATKKKR